MSIVYTLISRNTIVLSSYTNCSGNFEQLTLKILAKVEAEKRATYSYDKHYFHYVESNNMTTMCMTEQGFARASAFVFLDEIRESFLKEFSLNQISKANAHSLDSFNSTLENKMKYYNSNKEDVDKIAQLEKGVRTYSEDVIQANEIIEQRAGKVNMIVKKAENLRTESVSYFNQSGKVKKSALCTKKILIIFIVVILLVSSEFIIGYNLYLCQSRMWV